MARGKIKGSIADPLINIEPGDNTKFLTTAMEVQALGARKVDLRNYDDVRDRISQYFNLMATRDQKPTMTGLAMAMGFSHQRINEIVQNLPSGGRNGYSARLGYTENPTKPEVRELITAAVNVMKNLWEDYMQNGKINPACGIFLGKNFYDMKDEVEHHVTADVNPVDQYSAEDIAARYITDGREK